MKKVADHIYLDYEDLLVAGISLNTIKSSIKRGSWQALKDPDDGRRTLVCWHTLPQRYTKLVVQHWGPPSTWVLSSEPDIKLATLASALHTKPAHYIALLRRYPAQQAQLLARTAAAFELLAARHTRAELIALGVQSKEELHELVLQLLQAEALPGACTNSRVLRRKVSAWKDKGLESLTDGRIGNTNAAKLLDEEQKNTLLALMSSPQKPSVAVVTYLYNKQGLTRQWDTISEATARRFLNDPANRQIWTMARHGLDVHRKEYNLNVRRSGPTAPDVMWVIDGTPLELFYTTSTSRWNATTRRHESRTTRHNRLESVVVIDAFSWRIIGWALCATENAQSIKDALKQAVSTTSHLPLEIQHDNSSAAKSQRHLFESLANFNTSTRPYNGKSKIIENFFNHLQSSVLRYFPNWAGQGITTKRLDSHPNPDHLREIELPTLQAVQTQWLEAVTIWNNLSTEARQAPAHKYSGTTSAGTPVDTLAQVSLFWEKRDKTYAYRADGITLELDSKRHLFQVLDADFQTQSVGQRYQIAFDRDCLDYIYLYQSDRPVVDATGEPILAVAIDLVPMARADHSDETRAQLGRRLRLKDSVEELTATRVLRVQQYAQEYNIKADYREVFKDELNAAETASKTQFFNTAEDTMKVERLIRSMYIDDDDL